MTWVGKVLPLEMEPWQDRANCLGTDPEIFFPKIGKRSDEAEAVCAECPVQQQCRAYADALDEKFGVWGGESEQDRKRRRKRELVHT